MDAKEVSQIDLALARLKQLEEIERKYTWLMDCARKTGVIVTFKGATMSVVHGTASDAPDLLEAAQLVYDQMTARGEVSMETWELLSAAIDKSTGAA